MKRTYPYIQQLILFILIKKLHFKNYCCFSLFAIAFVLFSFQGNTTVYYVSSSGNDANKGTSEDFPWRSLDKVNRFFKLEPGDQVLFNRGDNWIGTLTVNASGISGSPIIYGAYGTGEKPKIYGSEVITGWTLHSGNIYKAKFTTDVTQIFVDGTKMKPARLTSTGYNNVNSVTSQTQFSCDALNAGFDYSGARVMLRTENWYSIMRTVTSSSSKTLTINSEPSGTIKANQGFLLMNKLEFLDSPGEWYYDTATDIVYLWTPDGDSPANYEIRGSTIANGFYSSAKSNITIQDLNILQQKDSGVKMQISGSNYITIQRNTISGQEGFGIFSEAGNEFLLIQNNVIDNCNGIGIYTFISNSIIRDNVITNIGVWETLGLNGTWNNNGGTGLEISGNGNTIEYNRVIGTNYNGIFWRGNSVLRYNFIKDVCISKSDGGGIYTGGVTASGSYVAYNIIDNVVGNKDGGTTGRNLGEGIYLDEPSLNITVEHNTVTRCSNSGIFLHRNENHIVRKNIVFDVRQCFNATKYSGNKKSQIYDNLFVAAKETDDYLPRQMVLIVHDANADFDSNTYISSFKNDLVFRLPVGSFGDFDDWKKFINGDTNSKFINTLLAEEETQVIFYNETKLPKIYNLGSYIFRDVYGKVVKDTFSLQPFTSKILIGKNFENINQSPSILDQSFNIIAPKITNDFIGQVVANDPDTGQTMYYYIVYGNENEWFNMDSTSGKIYTQTDIQTSKDMSFELIVKVKDNAFNSLSDSAIVVINIEGRDTSPPSITSFSIPSPAISLTIPITSFIAYDDMVITGYFLTETSVKPSAEDSMWSSVVPANFTFSREGVTTLFAWAKDSAGNVSDSAFSTVSIVLPDMSPAYSKYLFEEESGVTVIDSQGSNDGTIVKKEFRVAGAKGNGLALEGSDYIDLGQSFGENVQDEVTLSVWIKPTEARGDSQAIIMHGGPNFDSFALYIHPDFKRIEFKTSGTTNASVTIDNVSELWNGNWHHLALTYNGSEKVIYLDNIAILRIPATGKIESGWKYNLLIGAGKDEKSPTLFYKGLIDEVSIYNYALTASEIGELYHPVNRILKKIYSTEDIYICEGEDYMGWNESGQYERILHRVLESASEADSIVSTNLQFNPVYVNEFKATICEGENYTFGTRTFSATGVYTEIFQSIYECDSTVILSLSVHPTFNHTIETTICEGVAYSFGDQTLMVTGEYTGFFKTINGCDSTVNLTLTVNPYYHISEEITISNVESYMGWTKEGIFQRNLISSSGCDSIVVTHLTVMQAQSQRIVLEKGWNIFSSNIIPPDENMEAVMESILVEDKLIKIQDENNNTYEQLDYPIGWINNIGKIQQTEGYKIRVTSSCVLEIKGRQIDLPMNIEIKKGLNLISFPINESIDAMQVIEPLINAGILDKVQDEKGKSIEYWMGIGWINGIGNFITGKGYILYASESGMLTINQTKEKSNLFFNENDPQTKNFKVFYEGNGFAHMNINVVGLNESQLSIGDEIAVFDNHICVGAIKLTEKHFSLNVVGIPASASEDNLENGFTDGNHIEIRVWRHLKNSGVKLLPDVIKGKMIFNRYGSVFFKINEISDFDENIDIYPNPANAVVNIRFLSLPEEGIKIFIFDISGKEILRRDVKSNFEIIKVEDLPKGVYFVKIPVKNEKKTHKLIII